MNPSPTRTFARPAIAIVLAAVAVFAIVALGSSPAPSPSPSPSTPGSGPTPTGSPVVTPTAKPTESPTGDVVVDLDNLPGNKVSVLIDDETGTVVGAKSGRPGDGMSVRWFDAKVENVDAETLRIVWVGLPRDEQVRLSITQVNGTYRITIVQSAPLLNTDAIGYDRMLVLEFDHPVSADDVKVIVTQAPAAWHKPGRPLRVRAFVADRATCARCCETFTRARHPDRSPSTTRQAWPRRIRPSSTWPSST